MLSAQARIAYLNLGCRVNRVELDSIAAELEGMGCVRVSPEEAEAIVVNSCAVTGEAQAKTRKAIRHAAALPQAPRVIATGCAVSLFCDEIASLGKNVIVELDKTRVASRVFLELGREIPACTPAVRTGITATGRTRPGIKVQDGCDNRCTYCIVWKARGPARSRSAAKVVEMVQDAIEHGAAEVVLTGINLGRYQDDDGGVATLLERIMRETDIRRVRLSSIEPPDIDDALLRVMADSAGRVAPYLHVPLQSGCDTTLRHMGRTYDSASYREVVSRAREALPDLALCCDVIVGFPGETDADFEQSLAFCEEMGYAHMHVFRYSPRPGTPAAARTDQVPAPIKAARAARMRELSELSRTSCMQARVGKHELVVVQDAGLGVTGGLYDARVDESLVAGSFVDVVATSVTADGMLACEEARRLTMK